VGQGQRMDTWRVSLTWLSIDQSIGSASSGTDGSVEHVSQAMAPLHTTIATEALSSSGIDWLSHT
jgi:hypothetical protein